MSERGNTDKRRVADLAPWENNPRAMTPEARERLERSMAKFGDLSGVVFNRRTGRLVGGHQRRAHLPEDAEVQVVERWEEPNEVGTVAVGWIEVGGERWGYREVDVDERREKAMNIAANQHQGDFVDDLLAPIVSDLTTEYDFGLLGFEDAEGNALLDLAVGDPGEDEAPDPGDVLVMTYPVDGHFFALADALRAAGFELRKELVWVKDSFSFWRGAKFQQRHEPILLCARDGKPLGTEIDANETTVQEYPRPRASAHHPTARPLPLWSKLLMAHVPRGGVVYDPFGGSGTTLIAAEKAGRVCRMMELAPAYCDVIRRRYAELVGDASLAP